LALPAASKKENGQPYVETYGSKETNGEKVRLPLMIQDGLRGLGEAVVAEHLRVNLSPLPSS
jgi:hypothetical protein